MTIQAIQDKLLNVLAVWHEDIQVKSKGVSDTATFSLSLSISSKFLHQPSTVRWTTEKKQRFCNNDAEQGIITREFVV